MQRILSGVVSLASIVALLIMLHTPSVAAAPNYVALNDGHAPSAIGPSAQNGLFLGHADCEYAVTAGDTLNAIAAQYDTTAAQLARWNGIANINLIHVGQCLRVTSGGTTPMPGNTSPGVALNPLELCQSSQFWVGNIQQWTVPPGCYSGIYTPNQAHYPYRPGYGWCNWWPEEMHPQLPGVAAINTPTHSTPIVGAVVHFAPNEQGAGSVGHYAQVIAIHPQGYWVLISEMNDYWRGGGFERVNYRYIHLDPGKVSFLY